MELQESAKDSCKHGNTTSAGPWADRCLDCGAIGSREGFGGGRTVWPKEES
jgi:hypothetical protein